MTRTETTNDPVADRRARAMVSINTALQVDLHDQAGASHIGGRVYSGFGGQPDFVEGALHSPGGHAIIALRSWHEPSDSSTIVPRLSDPVTSFQHSAVITEQGCAHVFGRSQRAQARLIIEQAAHPDAREWLREAPPAGSARSRRRHLLGDAVDVAAAEQDLAGGDADDLALGEAAAQDPLGLAVGALVEQREHHARRCRGRSST